MIKSLFNLPVLSVLVLPLNDQNGIATLIQKAFKCDSAVFAYVLVP